MLNLKEIMDGVIRILQNCFNHYKNYFPNRIIIPDHTFWGKESLGSKGYKKIIYACPNDCILYIQNLGHHGTSERYGCECWDHLYLKKKKKECWDHHD